MEITIGLLSTSINFNVGMHLDFCKLIWFKCSVMKIDTIEPYILMPVLLASTLIQGHRIVRKPKLLFQLSPKVFDGFGWN